MKLWQAIILTIAIILVVLFLVPKELIETAFTIIMLVSAIWVYMDAKKINAKIYKSNLGMSPFALGVWTFILWAIFFPGYLWLKYRIKNNLVPIRDKYKNQNFDNKTK